MGIERRMASIRLDGGQPVKSGETLDDLGGEPRLLGRQPP